MTGNYPRAGEALALQRRQTGPIDLARLYASTTNNGASRDTMLFEVPGGRSILIDQAALRISCRGPDVEVIPLSPGGKHLSAWIAADLHQYLVGEAGGSLLLKFPRCASNDAEELLSAPSPFDVIRAVLFGLNNRSPDQPFALLAGGVVSFDHVDLFEELPPTAPDPIGFPDMLFWVAESLIVSDTGGGASIICTAFGSDDDGEAAKSYHAARDRLERLSEAIRSELAAPAEAEASQSCGIQAPAGEEPEVDVDLSDSVFAGVVTALKSAIARGDVFQVVPSRTFRTPTTNPFGAYQALRRADESPYHFFLSCPDHQLLGASPETSVRVEVRGDVRTVRLKPIAGTRSRGRNIDEDNRIEAELRLDQKEVAEHMMLVDLGRNDVARVSVPGSRHVVRLLTVERYQRVMHLVSSVEGELRHDYDALHALQACLNVGTLSGAPKLKAIELIRMIEGTRRGPYGGAVGWIAGNGELDTAVVIRSALVKDGFAHVRAGAGIVHDSDPAAETDETRRKASAVLEAIHSVEAAA